MAHGPACAGCVSARGAGRGLKEPWTLGAAGQHYDLSVTLFVNSTVSFGPGAMDVQITGGTSAAEYGTCSRYRVTTDGQGYGALTVIERAHGRWSVCRLNEEPW